MRRFFRFSIRDLLWLTLVVAMGLGWFVRERQISLAYQQQLDTAESKATWWRKATAALEDALREDRALVKWDVGSSQVVVEWSEPGGRHWVMTYLLLTFSGEPNLKNEYIPVNPKPNY
jgi:hypothetical protein